MEQSESVVWCVFNVSVHPCRDVCILSISSCIKCIYVLVEQSDSVVYKRRLRLKSFVHIFVCVYFSGAKHL